MLSTVFANTTQNDKNSQQDLQRILSNNSRCVLNSDDEGQTSILHLVKVVLLFGGYNVDSKLERNMSRVGAQFVLNIHLNYVCVICFQLQSLAKRFKVTIESL